MAEQKQLYSLETEQAVVGSILLDSTTAQSEQRVLDLALEMKVLPEWFCDSPCRETFNAILNLYKQNGTTPDPLMVTRELEKTNRLEAIGGFKAIEAILDRVPTTAHAENYLGELRRDVVRRKIVDVCSRGIAHANDENEYPDPDTLLGIVEREILAIGESHALGVPQTRLWQGDVESEGKKLCERIKTGGLHLEGLATGFNCLDHIIGGLRAGEVIILAARPSVGKTSLAMNIITNLTGDGHPVGFFSLEMTRQSLVQRELIARSGVARDRIQRGTIADDTREIALANVDSAVKDLGPQPVFINDTSGLDIVQLRSAARRMVRRQKVELIVIDYLQLITCHEAVLRRLNTNDMLAQISAGVKDMARELNVPVIALSQLSRKDSDLPDGYEKIKLSDLRGSGSIEQDADVVLLMRRLNPPGKGEPTPNVLTVEVNVAKNRNGLTDATELKFDRSKTQFFVEEIKS